MLGAMWLNRLGPMFDHIFFKVYSNPKSNSILIDIRFFIASFALLGLYAFPHPCAIKKCTSLIIFDHNVDNISLNYVYVMCKDLINYVSSLRTLK